MKHGEVDFTDNLLLDAFYNPDILMIERLYQAFKKRMVMEFGLLKLAESGEFVPWSGGESPQFPDGVFIELHFKDGSFERMESSEASFLHYPDQDWSVVGYKVLSVP